jgi:hypothetical protein
MSNADISFEKFALQIDKTDLRKALRQVGKDIKAEAQAMIRGAHSGAQYGSHQASAPGEAPATFLGFLAASIGISVKRDTLKVVDSMYYAVMLEAGAKGGGRGRGGASGKSIRRGQTRTATTDRVIAPRPYLSAALQKIDVQDVLDASLANMIYKRNNK